MTLLGLSAKTATANVDMGFRRGIFRHIGVVLGGASGAAVILGGYQLLRDQPERAFTLLQGWSPAFLLGMMALFVVGRFLDGLSQGVRESFSVVAGAVQNQAQASGRTADALTRLADQGGRQSEEIRRLAIYAGREFPSVYERFDRQDEALAKLASSVDKLASSMDGLHTRLDHGKRHEAGG